MTNVDRYRQLAEFCREQATLLKGEPAAAWLRLADEYEKLADGLRTQQHPNPKDEK